MQLVHIHFSFFPYLRITAAFTINRYCPNNNGDKSEI